MIYAQSVLRAEIVRHEKLRAHYIDHYEALGSTRSDNARFAQDIIIRALEAELARIDAREEADNHAQR